MRSSAVLLALAAILPPLAAAQVVPTRTLVKPDAEWSEPFSQPAGLRELKDGRVIVSDSRDKSIQLIDFKGAAKKIGREGSGPGEYGLPSAVFAAPGDMTWVFDLLNSRYLVIDATGKPVSTFTTVDAPSPSGPLRGNGRGGGGFGVTRAEGVDAQGRLYFRSPSVKFANGVGVMNDTIPIARWNPRTKVTDTVGALVNPPAPPAKPTSAGPGSVVVTMRMGNATPFGSSDTYVVTPGGDVAVLRARDYHVEWIANGRTVSAPPIKYDPVKIVTEDRRAFVEARKNVSGTMVIDDGNGRKVQNVPASSLDGADAPVFPEDKGPYRSALAGPGGQVWVERNVAFDAPPSYDVIDKTGKVASRVVLPKRTRVLGFGVGTIYLVRTDDDDLQYLQRYRW